MNIKRPKTKPAMRKIPGSYFKRFDPHTRQLKRDFPHMLDESLLRKMTTAQLLETFGNRVDPQIRTEMRGIEDALRQGKYTPTHFSMGLKEVRERIIVAIMGAEKR